ncbi:zinc finger, PMZ-type containing protein [Tanacetum coccineum]
MSKGKKDKNRVFVVNLKHDGIFSPYPFSYIHGDEKQLTDFDFEGMSYDNLRELVRKMVHSPVSSLYYCKVGKTIKQGLCRLENDAGVQEFLKTGYESKWVVDLYVEHHGYDPMDYKNSNDRDYDSPDSSDAYCSSNDEQVIDYVDFYHEGEQDVVVKNKANHHNARRHKALYYAKIVIPSGFQELEVRQGDQSFGVNLHLKKCMCKLWELSGIRCVHSVAACLFLNKVPDEGVDHWYSQDRRNCDKKQLPKPPQMKKQPGRNREPNFNSYALNRGGGRGSKGGRGHATGGMEFNEEAVRLTLEEEARYEKENQEKIREDKDSEYNQMWYNHGITPRKSASTRVEYGIEYVQTQESIAQPSIAATKITPRGKTIEADAAEPPKLKKQGRKRKVAEPSEAEPPFRIYHKYRGRSERIFNQKMKKIGFGLNGEGCTADKAFSL